MVGATQGALMLPGIVFTQRNSGCSTAAFPPPVTIGSCTQPAAVTPLKQVSPSQSTCVPGPRCCCAQAAISVRRKPSTTVSVTRSGCPCSLVSTAATNGVLPGARACRRCARPEIGIIVLDRPTERVLSVSLHHYLHQLVAPTPGGVVRDAKLAVQRHRRCTFLVLGHEVEAVEPHRERELGGVEEGPGGDGSLAMAAVALLELSGVQLTAPVMGAV